MILVSAIFMTVQSVDTDFTSKLNKIEAIASEDKDIEIYLLHARRAEKDFLLHKDEKYVMRQAMMSERASASIDHVDGLFKRAIP